VDTPVGDDRMRRHTHVRHEPVHRHRRQVLHVGRRHDGDNAAGAPRGPDVKPGYPRVGVGRAEQHYVEAAGRADVVYIPPRPHEQTMVFPSLQRPADPSAVRRPLSMRHVTVYVLAASL
jgi:hypothetical protein